MRKLLPYEHELIEILRVSEQEYLDFIAAQHDFTRSPEEKLQELRGDPVSAVLAVVGILFSVASVLLTPKPDLPSAAATGRTRREQVFAPRFGFNTAQELAKYGEPVNLIYTNIDDNADGGVRAAASLIWSAVHSEGSSQYMQMLLALGAGDIQSIAPGRTAFGQTAIRQLADKKTWLYFGNSKVLRFTDLIRPLGDTNDPVRLGQADGAAVYQANLIGDQMAEGFSQAFSPTTMTRCGIYAPIPIQVNYIDRKSDGGGVSAPLGIEIDGLSAQWPRNVFDDSRPVIPVGEQFILVFKALPSGSASDVRQSASELRRQLSSYIDAASTYKLGSAMFRVAKPIKNVELDDGTMRVVFECTKAGVCPREDYGTENFKRNGVEAEQEIVQLRERVTELDRLLTLNEPILKPGIGDSLKSRLKEIRELKDLIDDLSDRKWTSKELDDLLNNAELYDPVVVEYAQRVDDLRERRKQLQDNIEDELEKDKDKRNKNKIQQWRSEKRECNKLLKRAQAKLDKAFQQYGLADGVIPGRGKTLKQEKRYLNAREEKLTEEIADLTSKANNLDLAAMESRNSGWRSERDDKRDRIANLENYLKNPEAWNDWFNTKCLVKIEEAAYDTITNCRVVDFALKARVFKRIQGRAKEYGKVTMENYKNSDNGIKLRSMFFWVMYRRGVAAWSRVPYIFTIRRGADVDNFISLKFIAGDNDGGWQFRFEPIAETASEMITNGFADFAYIENSGDVQTISGPAGGQFTFLGSVRNRSGYKAPLNRNPSEVDEWGLFSMRSDTQINFSFDNGPELSIMAVTEQRVESFSTYPRLYNGLTLLGFNAYSGQGIQDLRSITAFVDRGKRVRRLRDDGTYPTTPDGASSYAPDIFLDTILDAQNGIGRFAKIGGIDLKALALAKRFCQRNALFMDGVIADQTAWRQFWAETAPFSLLELGRIGGRETLIPAIPCDGAGNITRSVPISALFNQGNILEDSYREELLDFGSNVQDLIASVIYRETEQDESFQRNRSVEISRSDVTEANAIRQTFDLSAYVTRRNQAILYGKLLCNQRRFVRRAIEFRTFPTDMPLAPGAYIYVAIGQNQWDQVSTGMVEAGGVLNTPIGQPANGSGYKALLYRSGSQVTTVTGVTVSGNTAAALASYEGWMFVLGTTITRKRVFRVTEVQMDEEGEVTVKAVEHPCEESGTNTLSLIADLGDNLFTIR